MNEFTVAKLASYYERGMMNPLEMATRLVGAITRDDIDAEMEMVPEKVMPKLRQQVEGYQFGRMILFNVDTEPTEAHIQMLRDWFARHPEEGRTEQDRVAGRCDAAAGQCFALLSEDSESRLNDCRPIYFEGTDATL